MGVWAKHEFSREVLPEVCYLFAGTADEQTKQKVLARFSEIKFHKHDIYERYIVSDGNMEYVLLFQIYGAILTADLLKVLKDGEVKKCYFIGYAFSFAEDAKVGDYFMSIYVQSLDGVMQAIDGANESYPDENILNEIMTKFNHSQILYLKGISVSVPCCLWNIDNALINKNVMVLEMEYASFCHFCKKLGIQGAGFFVISDTKNYSLLDDQTLSKNNLVKGFYALK